jgi:hypothetical protein
MLQLLRQSSAYDTRINAYSAVTIDNMGSCDLVDTIAPDDVKDNSKGAFERMRLRNTNDKCSIFDVTSLYQWCIKHGKKTHPTTREHIGEKGQLLAQFKYFGLKEFPLVTHSNLDDIRYIRGVVIGGETGIRRHVLDLKALDMLGVVREDIGNSDDTKNYLHCNPLCPWLIRTSSTIHQTYPGVDAFVVAHMDDTGKVFQRRVLSIDGMGIVVLNGTELPEKNLTWKWLNTPRRKVRWYPCLYDCLIGLLPFWWLRDIIDQITFRNPLPGLVQQPRV